MEPIWRQLTAKSWEQLYLDAFREAMATDRDRLQKYAAPDGEVALDEAALQRALHQELTTTPERATK